MGIYSSGKEKASNLSCLCLKHSGVLRNSYGVKVNYAEYVIKFGL